MIIVGRVAWKLPIVGAHAPATASFRSSRPWVFRAVTAYWSWLPLGRRRRWGAIPEPLQARKKDLPSSRWRIDAPRQRLGGHAGFLMGVSGLRCVFEFGVDVAVESEGRRHHQKPHVKRLANAGRV